MTVVKWLGCDLTTGQIIERLPDLVPQGQISARLGAYTSAAFNLPIPLGGNGAAPRQWETATEPGRTMIVAVLGGLPIWAGIVLSRVGGTAGTVTLSCVTLEGYLDRRYVSDHDWVFEDDISVIASGLIDDANVVEGIGFDVIAAPSLLLREREYLAQDDKTVYSALRELMGDEDGPEWTVTVGWSDSMQTAITKTLLVQQRIGIPSVDPSPEFPTGSTNAVFSSTGSSNARYVFSEDFSAGRGANHVIAVGTGEGVSRPESSPARDEVRLAAGWPRYELRYRPGSSVEEEALGGHAQRVISLMGAGARSLTISARADATPMLGTDWALGDDVGYKLKGHRHPNGLNGVGRAIGWEFDAVAGLLAPILFVPELEGTA